ncbi:MAG: hypothetical protein WC523_02125 [Patescibacteria group bacterium]|jgi:riboflavin transporter FmnP
MALSPHLLIHFLLALLVGFLVGRHFKRIEIALVAAIVGGFLIDFDHLLEYFLVFGLSFNFAYFLEGREFLLSSKIHLWFHAWEYVILLLGLTFFFKKNKTGETILVALALAILVHLLTDAVINQYPLKYYSFFYRQEVNFAAEKLLSPEEYLKNLELKQELGI